MKVLYLLAVTALVFAVPAFSLTRPARWFVVAGLLAVQAIALLVCGVEGRDSVRPAWRLKWLFVFLILCYALLPPESPSSGDVVVGWPVPGPGWTVPVNLTGVEQAGLMCLQILAVLLASALVRSTGSGRDLVDGLQAFRLPALFVHALDNTLELLGGVRQGRGGGGRGGRNRSARTGFVAVLKQVMRGELGFFLQTIQTNIEAATNRAAAEEDGRRPDPRLAHDVVVVTGIALCMASLKMLKFLPGVPFASGHKVLLLFPLYVLASRMTHSRWGGTAAGSIMGVIGFLQGDGRFGLLEVLKHIAPGLVIDLGYPLVRRLPPWAFGYCLLGLVAAVARTGTEFLVVLLLGARAEVYIFPAVKLVPNLLAGFLSGFATVFILRAFDRASGDSASQGPTVAEPGGDAPLRPSPDGQGALEQASDDASSSKAWSPGSGKGGGSRRGQGRGRESGP